MLVARAAVFGLIEATGMFSEIKIIELLTASEIDHGLAKSVTYRAACRMPRIYLRPPKSFRRGAI
jgi:hypothetical protein